MKKITFLCVSRKLNQQFLKIEIVILTIVLIFSIFETSVINEISPVAGEYTLQEYGTLNVTSPLGVETDASGYVYIASSNYNVYRYGPNNEQYNMFTLDHYPELFCYHDHSLFVGLKGTGTLYVYDRTGIYSHSTTFKATSWGGYKVKLDALISAGTTGFYGIGKMLTDVHAFYYYRSQFSSSGDEIINYAYSTTSTYSTTYSKIGVDGTTAWWYYEYSSSPRLLREEPTGANIFTIVPSARIFGLDFDNEGYCYAAMSDSVVVYNTLGEVVTTTILDFTPSDLEISELGLLYLVDTPNNKVHVYTLWYEPGGGGFPGGTAPGFELFMLLISLLIIKYWRYQQ